MYMYLHVIFIIFYNYAMYCNCNPLIIKSVYIICFTEFFKYILIFFSNLFNNDVNIEL